MAVPVGTGVAQNPIASKVVGSDVARRNRRLLRDHRERADRAVSRQAGKLLGALPAEGNKRLAAATLEDSVRATLPSFAEQILAAGEVAAYLGSTGQAPATLAALGDSVHKGVRRSCVGNALGARAAPADSRSAVYQLEMLCTTPELAAVVPDALRFVLSKTASRAGNGSALQRALAATLRDTLTTTAAPVVQALAAAALDRVLYAVERGHTNPQRWYLGGQLGLRLVGDGDNGLAARASARAAYFVPISPFQKWQLPVVTNLRDLADARPELQGDKLKKLATSSEGAFLSLEPTMDPYSPGRFKDWRVQPFAAIGGQLNTLRGLADTTKQVQFGQGRFGAGTNVEIGTPAPGRPNVFLTSRVVWRLYSPGAAQQALGTRNRGTPVLESFALVPIGGATSLLAEVSASRGTAPVVRIALWAQATPQQAAAGAKPAAEGP